MIFQNAYISAEIGRNGQLSSSLERLIETSWRNIASHHCNNVEHLLVPRKAVFSSRES